MNHHMPDKEYDFYFDRYTTTNIVFGEGAFAQLGEELMLRGIRIAALVIGTKSAMKADGVYTKFIQTGSPFDLETPCLCNVPAEPDTECIREMVKSFEAGQPEAVIAIGGGSVLDAAKTAYLSWQSGMDVSELFGVNRATDAFPGKQFKRVICMPTTSGTGSEVTRYANIVDREKDVKCLIVEEAIVPDLALIDPALTMTMPEDLTLATALDALAHSVESLLNTKSPQADPDSGKWARLAIRLIVQALPAVRKKPENPLAREMLSAAATLGGMCINCRPTGLPHLCSFSFYGKVPHGIAVAALLPVFWRFYLNDPDVKATTESMKGLFPGKQETTGDVIEACAHFIAENTGIRTLSDLPEFDREMIGKMAKAAKNNPVKLQTAPRSIKLEEAEQILTGILEGAL